MNPRAQRMFSLKTAVAGTRIKLGVGVLPIADDGRLLLELRSDCGMWGLLGGGVDPGESITQTALREVAEESGLTIEITRLLGIYSTPADRILIYPDNGDVRHLIDVVVIARITGGTLQISHESERLEFFDLKNLPPETEIIPPARDPLADFLAGRQGLLG